MEFLPSDSSDDEENGLNLPHDFEDKTDCKESTTNASNASTAEDGMKTRPAKKARFPQVVMYPLIVSVHSHMFVVGGHALYICL